MQILIGKINEKWSGDKEMEIGIEMLKHILKWNYWNKDLTANTDMEIEEG